MQCLYSLVISGITFLSCQSPDRISELEGRKEIESQAILPTGTPRPGRSDFPHITQQARDRNRMNLGVPRSSGLGSSTTLGVCPYSCPLTCPPRSPSPSLGPDSLPPEIPDSFFSDSQWPPPLAWDSPPLRARPAPFPTSSALTAGFSPPALP